MFDLRAWQLYSIFTPQSGDETMFDTATLPAAGALTGFRFLRTLRPPRIPFVPRNPNRLYHNQMPENLAQELADAARVGVVPTRAGASGFNDLVNDGTIKWVVTETGELFVGPHTRFSQEISHAVLANGAPVRAAGEANISAHGRIRIGMDITHHSGHYQPSAESVEIGKEAFRRAGVYFD